MARQANESVARTTHPAEPEIRPNALTRAVRGHAQTSRPLAHISLPALTLGLMCLGPAQLASLGTAQAADVDDALQTYVADLCPSGYSSCDSSLPSNLRSELDSMFTTTSAGTPEREAALRALAYEETSSQGSLGVEFARSQRANVLGRMSQLRGGATGVNVAGLTLEAGGRRLSGDQLAAALGTDARGGGGAADDLGGRWGAFVNGTWSTGERDGTSLEPGFDFDGGAITAGADYRVNDNTVVGASLGYANGEADLDGNAGDSDTDNYTLSAFGTHYRTDRFYVDGLIGYGSTDYETTRRFTFIGTPYTARGETDGDELTVGVGAGYEIVKQGWNLSPFARLNYMNVEIDSYRETGASPLNMTVQSQDIDSLVSLIGVEFSRAFSQRWGVLVPQGRVEWAHEFEDESRLLQGRFVGDADAGGLVDPVAVSTDDQDSDFFNVGLGVSAQFAQGRSAFVYYETVLGLDDVEKHALTLGGRFEF